MYKVKNKTNQVKKFRDKYLGKDILVDAKKYVLTNNPPTASEVFSVEEVKEKIESEESKEEIYVEKKEKKEKLN